MRRSGLINLRGFIPTKLSSNWNKFSNSVVKTTCLLCFIFFSATAQKSEKVGFLITVGLQKCAELNDKIEEENDHNIWVKYNAELKRIASQKLQNQDLSTTERAEFRRYLAIAFLNEGAYHNYVDKYAEAIGYYKKSLKITIADKNHGLTASNFQNIGTVHDFLGNLDSTLIYLQKALIFAQKSKNESNIAYVLTDLGYTYKNIGDFKAAIRNNIEALKLFKKLKDDGGLERTYFAIARIFSDQREYKKSENYYLKGLAIAESSEDLVRQCLILNGLAAVQLAKKDYPKLDFYAQKTFKIAQQNNFVFSEAMTFQILGERFLQEEKYAKAQESLKRASAIFTDLGNGNHNAKTLLLLAKSYLKTRKYSIAKPILTKAYEEARRGKFPGVRKEAAELLAQLYFDLTDYKTAFSYQQEARKMSDSLFRDENKNAALKAEYSYQNELKESQLKAIAQEKQLAELQSERQNVLIYSILAGTVLLASFAYFLFKGFKTKKENELLTTKLEATENRLRMEERAKESEMKALKSQMNPHFMFNALNTIQEQFMYGDKNVANEQMGNFTYLTRQVLTVSGKKKIKLSTEIEILIKYLELEKMRFAEGFTYAISLGETVDEDYYEIPPMLIQPFVENSVKHGLLHKVGNKTVNIRFDLDEAEENLLCTVEDNGIGRQKSAEINRLRRQKHESFSIVATNERLKLMTKSSDNQDFIVYLDLLSPDNTVIGTKVCITIPLC